MAEVRDNRDQCALLIQANDTHLGANIAFREYARMVLYKSQEEYITTNASSRSIMAIGALYIRGMIIG